MRSLRSAAAANAAQIRPGLCRRLSHALKQTHTIRDLHLHMFITELKHRPVKKSRAPAEAERRRGEKGREKERRASRDRKEAQSWMTTNEGMHSTNGNLAERVRKLKIVYADSKCYPGVPPHLLAEAKRQMKENLHFAKGADRNGVFWKAWVVCMTETPKETKSVWDAYFGGDASPFVQCDASDEKGHDGKEVTPDAVRTPERDPDTTGDVIIDINDSQEETEYVRKVPSSSGSNAETKNEVVCPPRPVSAPTQLPTHGTHNVPLPLPPLPPRNGGSVPPPPPPTPVSPAQGSTILEVEDGLRPTNWSGRTWTRALRIIVHRQGLVQPEYDQRPLNVRNIRVGERPVVVQDIEVSSKWRTGWLKLLMKISWVITMTVLLMRSWWILAIAPVSLILTGLFLVAWYLNRRGNRTYHVVNCWLDSLSTQLQNRSAEDIHTLGPMIINRVWSVDIGARNNAQLAIDTVAFFARLNDELASISEERRPDFGAGSFGLRALPRSLL